MTDSEEASRRANASESASHARRSLEESTSDPKRHLKSQRASQQRHPVKARTAHNESPINEPVSTSRAERAPHLTPRRSASVLTAPGAAAQAMPNPMAVAIRGFGIVFLSPSSKLAECWDAHTGLRACCPNFQPKNVEPKVRHAFQFLACCVENTSFFRQKMHDRFRPLDLKLPLQKRYGAKALLLVPILSAKSDHWV